MERNKGKRLSCYVEDYVVFDLETTGIDQNSDAIIEISAVKVERGAVLQEYATLVNPMRGIPKAATAVNGITDDMVAQAPYIAQAMAGFMEFVGESILVGHNIHTFDTNFAYDAAKRSLGKELRNDYIDTLYLARKCLPQLRRHRLVDVSAHFHIATTGAHRALNDCIMNQRCYEELGKLLVKLPENKQEDILCPVCGGELIVRKGKFGAFYGCGSYPSCRYTRNV